MIAKLRISVYWAKALGHVSRHDYDFALERVRKIQKLMERIDKDVPLKKEVDVLEGFLHYAEGDFSKAVDLLVGAIKKIDTSDRDPRADKDYLKCYASVWGLKSLEEGGIERETNFVVNYGSVHLDKVSMRLRRNFPLRDHPDWDESAIRKSWRVKK